jgi:hypothetical protein
MTPERLVPLRLAATVAHALPGVRLRLRHGGRIVLEVGRSPSVPPLPGGMGPCAFRMAVGRAHEQLQEGTRLAFFGMAEGCAPAIDVGVGEGDRVYPGGLYRVAVGDMQVHAFVTTLAPKACRPVVAARVGDRGPVKLHHDTTTAVTMVHAATPADGPVDQARGLFEDLLAGCLVEEVVSAGFG